MKRFVTISAIVATVLSIRVSVSPASQERDARLGFSATIDPVIAALWSGYDMSAAMEHVRFINQYWRLAGNPGYNATVDRIRDRVTAAGLKVAVEEYPTGPAWDYSVGTVAIAGSPEQIVLSRDKERLALCINSFSTPSGGITAPLVDVGAGRDQDYEGKTLKGAIVLGDPDVGALWRRAVQTGGALGVISTALPRYLNADPPGVAKPTPRDQWDILQWDSVPYDEARKAFGFKASPRAAATLRARLSAAGAAGINVHVTIVSSFTTGPARTLVAEIPGTTMPAERIVMAAHIQEPGANDNASGVATLAELAVSMANAIKQKKIAAPARTLTFLFLNEISGSRRWLQDHAGDAKQVKYMFSLDMTGEDVTKTGGTFLVERYPDPGAVWDRPWDPHTEWGRGNVRADSLKGDLINDAHLAVLRRVAERSTWVVSSNPYEGGSDHTVFQGAGVPSVLDWHFTDRYYHTNFDTPDKTSPEEIRNVGVSVGTTAWLFATSNENIAISIADVVAAAGKERIAVEQQQGAKFPDSAAALTAWRKWYGEAVRSASRLVVGTPSTNFGSRLEVIASVFNAPGSQYQAAGLTRGLPALKVTTANQAPIGAKTIETGSAKFACGNDATLPDPIAVRWTTVVLAGDARQYTPCPDGNHYGSHREVREGFLLNIASGSADTEIRWRAAQALARLGRGVGAVIRTATVRPVCKGEVQIFGSANDPLRWQPGELFMLLRDRDARIRREAAYGIGYALSRPGLDPLISTAARKELEACVLIETTQAGGSPEVAGLLLEAMGATRYAKDEDRAAAAAYLLERTRRPAAAEVLGAAKGLEVLIRQASGWEVPEAVRARLRQLAIRALPSDPDDPRLRRLAMLALQDARDADASTLDRAANADDWQVRRIVAMSLNLDDPNHASIGDRMSQDLEFKVRYEYLGALSRNIQRTHLCEPLAKYLDDREPTVVLRAMDLLSARCTDLDDTVKRLVGEAKQLQLPNSTDHWHIPSRALTALARIRPDEAKPLMEAAAKHSVWQVRAAAAAPLVNLGQIHDAVLLTWDSKPNVQAAALEALTRAKVPDVIDAALRILRSGMDFQLMRTAADAITNIPSERRNEATDALLGGLTRLTMRDEDPSRDPRVAILSALGRVMPKDRSQELVPFLSDVDDSVVEAATKAFHSVTPDALPSHSVVRRYPYQPAEQALLDLPRQAFIQLDEGIVVIDLLKSEAPVTIARFVALVKAGYYNGLTFHRIVPNFVVQGGSPGASEYVGTSRFMRDEVGPASHLRGAVGISTRGHDTGDAQIFIDLVDVPRLDRDYTVFAYVSDGMQIVDRLLEGAVIKSITLK